MLSAITAALAGLALLAHAHAAGPALSLTEQPTPAGQASTLTAALHTSCVVSVAIEWERPDGSRDSVAYEDIAPAEAGRYPETLTLEPYSSYAVRIFTGGVSEAPSYALMFPSESRLSATVAWTDTDPECAP